MIAIMIEAGARNIHPAAFCFVASVIPFSWNSRELLLSSLYILQLFHLTAVPVSKIFLCDFLCSAVQLLDRRLYGVTGIFFEQKTEDYLAVPRLLIINSYLILITARKGLLCHLECQSILSFLKCRFFICAVYNIYNCCVDAFSCFIMIRCFCELRNMRRVFYNCGEDWLSTKELVWLVVNLRLTSRQVAGNCTCLRKDCIIEVCAGTKCACKEVFCKFYILAVGCNVPGRSTIVSIVCSCINIVYLGIVVICHRPF